MVDSNRSYCLRLASVTFPLLSTRPASTAASMPQQQARLSVSQPALPATAPVSVREELATLFGRACDPPISCLESVENLALALEVRPDVQSRLATITQYTPSKWLLERELEASGHWPFSPLAEDQAGTALEEKPSTINSSPEENGWLAKIKLSNAGEIDNLMDAEAYNAFTEKAE